MFAKFSIVCAGILLIKAHSNQITNGNYNASVIGSNNSVIINTAHTQQRDKNKENIRSNLRIPIDAVFLDRPYLIKQMEEKLEASSHTENAIQTIALVGIVGIGGAGKTTLARFYGKSRTAPVVWEINVETRETLINSFSDLAYALAQTTEQKEELSFIKAMRNIEEMEKQIVAFVKEQLKARPGWLLIYDNAESLADLTCFFPDDIEVWGRGKVIITTRNANILNSSHIDSANIIQVDQLNQQEALTLLCKILYKTDPCMISAEQRKNALIFLTNIPPFPLDVSVAVYYIRNAQITFEQYLERISTYSKSMDNTHEHIIKEVIDYSKTRYGIISLSFKKLIERHADFKGLLFLMCLLDSQNIPKELFEFYKPDLSMIDLFIHDLKKYSLITFNNESKKNNENPIFSLHRSTQHTGLMFFLNLLTDAEKTKLLKNSVVTIQKFYELNEQKNRENVFLFIPHLETFLKNLKEIRLSKFIKELYLEEKLRLLLGYSYYKGASNLARAKEYFYESVKNGLKYHTTKELANILRDFGALCVDLKFIDEGLKYCKKSIHYFKEIPGSEILIASNQKIIGVAYFDKNNFNEAEKYYKTALKTLSTLKNTSLKRKDAEAEVYDQLASIYSRKYINKDESDKAVYYIIKSLETLDATCLFYSKEKDIFLKEQLKISLHIAKHKLRLGQVYARRGDYKTALEKGFREADYILNFYSKNGTDQLLKAQVFLGQGEIALRNNHLNEAYDLLSTCMKITEQLVGHSTRAAKILRIETLIRLEKHAEAYTECESIFTVKNEQRWQDNYSRLTYLMCIYHAAIVKYKQNDLQKSSEHFNHFLNEAQLFCKHFLSKEKYKILELKNVFSIKNQEGFDADIRVCLQGSYDVFSIIFGDTHPFIQGYVLKNKKSY